MAELTALADEFALPVVQSEARDISLPTDHAMCLGFDPGPYVGKADVLAGVRQRGAVDPARACPSRATPR